MQLFRKTSIKQKQMLIIMLTSMASLLVACSALVVFDFINFRHDMVAELSTHAEIIGNNCTAALDFNDRNAVRETLAGLAADANIRGAAVYTKDGEVFGAFDRPNDGEKISLPPVQASGFKFTSRALLMFRPIVRKGDVVGTVFVESGLRALYSRLEEYGLIVLAVLCGAGLVAYALSSQLQRVVSSPILSLVETARSVAREQNFSQRAVRQSEDELGVLVDSFNEMLTQIEQRDSQLQKAKDLLELRVEERTRELQQRTEELHEEVLLHKRTEEALAVSERLMVSLVETLPQNVLRKDPAGRFTFVNGFFCRTLGKTKAEILGKTDFDFFPGELAAKFKRDDEQVIASGKPFETEEENQTLAGERVYVQVIKTPLFDAEQKPIGLQVVFWDVTARKKAEVELAYERDLLKTLLDNSPEVIYFKDLQSRFVRFSKSCARIFNQADAEAIRGKTDFDFFTPEDALPFFEDEQEIIRSGKPMLGKLERETHADGRVTWAMTSKLPWHDERGNIIGTFGISQNITSIKEAEAKLEAVHRQLVDASRQAGMAEVATSVLHNVGNVLNSINVTATLVDERVRKSRAADLNKLVKLLGDHTADLGTFLTVDPRGSKVPEFLGHLAERLAGEQALVLAELASLRKNVEHVKDIVAMQQSYAKISGVIEKLEVTELVEDTLRMNAAAFARHDVRIVREYNPVPPISTDKHKALQILTNVVRNAKYACDQSGRGDKQVTVRVTNGEECVRISVIDNGVGIPPENLTRIFNHGFTTRKDGHGFGLHSGALAAKELGGILIAQSDGTGKGATFILELPQKEHSAFTALASPTTNHEHA